MAIIYSYMPSQGVDPYGEACPYWVAVETERVPRGLSLRLKSLGAIREDMDGDSSFYFEAIPTKAEQSALLDRLLDVLPGGFEFTVYYN